MDPLVTINILSYNRIDELRHTLKKVYEQDYKNIEVIVVDNASSDGTLEMVKTQFPDVKLIKLGKNIGIAGWNKGFEVAKGEYVLVLDDDAYPAKDAIQLIVDDFGEFPNHGAIALKVMNIYENNLIQPFPGGWVPIRLNENIKWSLILGCAFAMQKELYINDLFSQNYFISFHELPIVLQIFRKGFLIKYSPKIIAYHINQKIGKYNKENECLHFRNMSNFILYHFSKPQNIIMLLRVAIFYFSRSIRKGWFVCYLNSTSKLKKPLVTFTKAHLSKEETINIISTGIIEYKLTNKFKIKYEKN